MRLRITKAEQRGHNKIDWLDSWFSYSFNGYFNPARMGFGDLRVVNDDVIQPSSGFGTHAHDNMEIISVPVYGSLSHKDSTGSEGTVSFGEVQVMSAGSGVEHSEFNASDTEEANFFQIWIQTKQQNIAPRYDQKKFEYPLNQLTLIVSGDEQDDALTIHQDARIWWGSFESGQKISFELAEGKGLFLMVVEGALEFEGESLTKRDAVEVAKTTGLLSGKTTSKTTILAIEVKV